MPICYNMSIANQAGLSAHIACLTKTFVNIQFSTQQIVSVSQGSSVQPKPPFTFMFDLLSRMPQLIGPIWCAACNPISPPTANGTDMSLLCEFDSTTPDVRFLRNPPPSIQWLDAITSFNALGPFNPSANPPVNWFHMDLQTSTPGVNALFHAPHSILV